MNGTLILKHESDYITRRVSSRKRSIEKSVGKFHFWFGENLTPKLSIVTTSDLNKSFLSEPDVESSLKTQRYEWKC